MKKILLLLVAMSALTACEESTSTNKIVMQGRINNSFWKSVNVTAIKDANGNLTLTGLNGYDQLELKTSSAGVGTYNLGTNNANNSATYNFFADEAIYKTSVFASPVNQIKLVSSGSGYLDVTSAATTGGSGSGLRVNIKADLVTGAVTEIEVNAPGNGYKSGDLITIANGNNNATFEVLNVTKSNGEIIITENLAGRITGSFKLTAVNEVNGKTIVFRDGFFYKVLVK